MASLVQKISDIIIANKTDQTFTEDLFQKVNEIIKNTDLEDLLKFVDEQCKTDQT